MLKKVITFDASAKEDILALLNKTIDEEGYIVEKSNTAQRVLTPEGDEIKLDQLGAIKKGSEIFIKSDLISLINLADTLT